MWTRSAHMSNVCFHEGSLHSDNRHSCIHLFMYFFYLCAGEGLSFKNREPNALKESRKPARLWPAARSFSHNQKVQEDINTQRKVSKILWNMRLCLHCCHNKYKSARVQRTGQWQNNQESFFLYLLFTTTFKNMLIFTETKDPAVRDFCLPLLVVRVTSQTMMMQNF